MARTNIEEGAFRRVSKLAGLMGCSDREALGTVAYLWSDSQDILAFQGTREQIAEWCHLFNMSDDEITKWISSLERARIISIENDITDKNGGPIFRIHGNEIQIENMVSYSVRASKGGKALKKKWKEKKRLGASLKHSSSTLPENEKQAPSTTKHYKSKQNNSKQNNTNTNAPEIFSELSAFYRDTFPGTTTGPSAKARFADQVREPEDVELIRRAIVHYSEFLKHDANSWRKPKTSFETFLGTKSSGFFWKDFVDPPALPLSPSAAPDLSDLNWTGPEGAS